MSIFCVIPPLKLNYLKPTLIKKNNEPGGKMVWYPRDMKRTNVSGVYPSSAGGGLVIPP
jgi:hypothetical protein